MRSLTCCWGIIVVSVPVLIPTHFSALNQNHWRQGKSAGAWDNTKALWKQPDQHQLLPRLLGNQSLLFYCWMLEGVQLVQPLSDGRYAGRQQSVMGRGIPVTWSKRLFWLLFDYQRTVSAFTHWEPCRVMPASWCMRPSSHACLRKTMCSVSLLFI